MKTPDRRSSVRVQPPGLTSAARLSRRFGPRLLGTLASACGALTLVSSAHAQDPAKGREMAEALCARCHMNEGQGEKRGASGIPGFRAVANRPGQTEADVVNWLKSVPPMMPNHHLTQDEMYALAAFIMTLRISR